MSHESGKSRSRGKRFSFTLLFKLITGLANDKLWYSDWSSKHHVTLVSPNLNPIDLSNGNLLYVG